jgi:hypothetical protein
MGRYDPAVLDRERYVYLCLRQMVSHDYTTVFVWEMLIDLLEQAAEQEKSFVESGSDFEEDSPAYFEALMHLRLAFDAIALPKPTMALFTTLITNPMLRHRFHRHEGTDMDVGIRPNPGENIHEDPFLWMVWEAFEHMFPATRFPNIPHDDVLVEIHRLVEEDRTLRARLTPLALKAIAEAGHRADLRCQLTSLRSRIFAPFHGFGFEKDLDRAGEVADNWVREKYDWSERLHGVIDDKAFPNLSKLADPAKGRFTHPAHKKRNKVDTLAMQAAEKNLDGFWEAFDKAVEEKDAELMRHIKSWWTSRTHIRTPDWVDDGPSKLPRPQVVLPRISAQLTNLSIVDDRPKGKTAVLKEAGEKKEKVKTRGVADPSKAADQDVGNQGCANRPPTPPPPVFKVDRRTMKVIGLLFHRPGERDHPGELDWKDVLHAMAEIGFSAIKAYGSAWNFVPVSEQLTSWCSRDIMVHEPHPTSKMSFWRARQFGQRLTYRHKLDASCFEK